METTDQSVTNEYYIGSDIGGTFTDVVVLDANGRVVQAKSSSTPPEFDKGLINALSEAAAALGTTLPSMLENTKVFAHGCTVATNVLVSRRGAKVGVITTKGFEETLGIMRGSAFCQGLPVEDWYHKSTNERPFEIVAPKNIIGVTERTDRYGKILAPLAKEEVLEAADQLITNYGCETIAICFLWSHVNQENEEKAASLILDKWPKMTVTTSSSTLKILGEYERFSTTVISSYVRPELEHYTTNLARTLKDTGLNKRLLIMQASGGLTPEKKATSRAVSVLHSGPVGGVAAAIQIASLLGETEVITADMGGTSFDVSVVANGRPRYTTRSFHERHVVAAPMVDVASIGAGGGSIARVANGRITVGPESAGANPGPVCYGRGGTEPTVTDANLVLGYINPEFFLGGKMPIQAKPSMDAIDNLIAKPLSISLNEAAYAIHRIANAHMVDLMRFYLIQRGYNPPDFTLFVFGGATGLHACNLAEELGAKQAIVPLAGLATVMSAFGIANSDVLRVASAANAMPFPPEDPETIRSLYLALEKEAVSDLEEDGFTTSQIDIDRMASMRYHLQLTDVEVDFPAGEINANTIDEVTKKFDERYAKLYGPDAGFKEAGRDLMSEFVHARGKTPKGRIDALPLESDDPGYAIKGERECYFGDSDGITKTTPFYDGDKLQPGAHVVGPAVLEMSGTTVVVTPGFSATYDGYRNVHLKKTSGFGERNGGATLGGSSGSSQMDSPETGRKGVN